MSGICSLLERTYIFVHDSSSAIREALQYGAGLQRPPEEIIAQTVRQAVADALDGLRVLVAEQSAALEPNNIEEQFGAQLDDLLAGLDNR